MHYRRTNENFCGTAFVSFYEEKYKNKVLKMFDPRYSLNPTLAPILNLESKNK